MYGATDDEQDTRMVSCSFLPDGSCMPEGYITILGIIIVIVAAALLLRKKK